MQSSRRSELALVGWAALTFGALLASFSAFRPVRDALILDGKPDDIPWLFIGTFIAVTIASSAWSSILSRRAHRSVVPVAFHVFALCAIAFSVLVREHVAPVAVGRAFYIWSAVYNLFVVSVFWSLLSDLLGPDKATRLFGPVSAGGTIGAIVGPALTKLIVGSVGVAGVLVMSALLLEIAVVGAWQLKKLGNTEPAELPAKSTPWAGIARVAKEPYLLAICGYVLCLSVAATFLYLDQASIVKVAFKSREARTDFFASLDLWTQLATLVVQTLVAAPLLRRFGPGIVLAVLPLAQLGAQIALGVTGRGAALTVLVIAMITTRTVQHGLTRPARELLFTVVDREDKYHAKNVIDTIVYRLGDVGSGWLYSGLLSLAAGAGTLAIASAPLTAAWLALAVVLGSRFRRRAAFS
ncbi:MAG TPA: Npt1/Npt2 family nucleotide transporter [Kofleriaceae bacterium]|jgi:AAA family ATP:ADP antiporter